MKTYLLDTNACIALINGSEANVRRRFQRAARKNVILLSSISNTKEFSRVSGLKWEDWAASSPLRGHVDGPNSRASSIGHHPPRPRSHCSGRSSAAAKTCTRADSRAGRRVSLAMRPRASNEWVRGICEKPRIKCAECPNRRFLPVTDDVIRWHLSGHDPEGEPFVAGVYPLLLDETCFFLAVDFDKAGWQRRCLGFPRRVSTLEPPGRPRAVALRTRRARLALLRGGHSGGAGPAAGVARPHRNDGGAAGHRTGFVRPPVSEPGHDAAGRIREPDCLAAAEGAREQDNSVFLDDNLVPWADQWAFLASVRRIGRSQVERIVQEAERRGRILGVRLPPQDDGEEAPWTAPPSRHRKEPPIVGELPQTMELVLGNQIYIAKDGLHPGLRNRLLRLAAFQNPEFYKAQAMRLSTYDKPRVIACAEDHPHHIGLPRGCLDDVRQALTDLRVRTTIRDERSHRSHT